MKRLEYHFARVSAPAPKRLMIESRSDGSHSISDGDDNDHVHASIVDDCEVSGADDTDDASVLAGASSITVSSTVTSYDSVQQKDLVFITARLLLTILGGRDTS